MIDMKNFRDEFSMMRWNYPREIFLMGDELDTISRSENLMTCKLQLTRFKNEKMRIGGKDD